jgi:hypothetical protein
VRCASVYQLMQFVQAKSVVYVYSVCSLTLVAGPRGLSGDFLRGFCRRAFVADDVADDDVAAVAAVAAVAVEEPDNCLS